MTLRDLAIAIASDLAAEIPGLYVEALVIDGVDPAAEPPGLAARIAALGAHPPAMTGAVAVNRDHYRALHEKIYGADARHLPAAENLLERFVAQGRFPRIHPLVDAANAVSVAELRPIGVFDGDRIHGRVTLRRSAPGEKFVPLGKSKPEKIKPAGSVILADEEKVFSMIGVRDSGPTMITGETRRVLALSWARTEIPRADLRGTLERYAALLLG